MLELTVLPFIAFFIGMVAAMAGIGGGVFMVPILTLLFGFEPAHASGTSIAVIVFTSLSSVFRYSKQRRIDYLLGFLLASTTIPGAFIGSYLTKLIEKRTLGLIFAFFLMFVAFRSLMKGKTVERKEVLGRVKGRLERRIVDNYNETFVYSVNTWLIPILGLAGGFFSGLLGIGGGAVLVPAMNLALGVPIHITVATSMFIMVFTSTSGALTHLWLQHVHLDYVALLAAGVIFGAQVGAHYARKVSAGNLKRLFGVILLIASIRMILKYSMVIP
ncbi:sulfite exporter TauE/SafE family protein [Candidatus Bathyarchaeota archaeon]|nr:MAG: sulfite exporter TauE/SafE family protein [Candidatus Bathyarchaeota archaeon]